MKKSVVLIILLLSSMLILFGCSKKTGVDRVYGKWKAVDFEDAQQQNVEIEVTYEFTEDKIINDGTAHGEPLERLEFPYVVKSADDTMIVLEATHSKSQQKGDFKITFDGDKLKLTDPDGSQLMLIKQ
jgi:hypothetical protein